MTKFKAVYILSILLLLASCSNSKKECISFNNTLVESKILVDSCLVSNNQKITSLLNDSLYENVLIPSKELERIINNEISKIQNLKVPVYGDSLKTMLLSYYYAIIDLNESYNGYALLSDENVSIEELDSIKSKISASENEVNKVLSLLILSQKEFAEKANIKLENDK